MDHQHYPRDTLNSPKAGGAVLLKALKVSLFQKLLYGLKPKQTPFAVVQGSFPEAHVRVFNTGSSQALQLGRKQRPPICHNFPCDKTHSDSHLEKNGQDFEVFFKVKSPRVFH